MIKIDKNIPMPKSAGGGSVAKFPFAEMEVGDSFYVERAQNNTSNLCGYWAKKLSAKFITRKEGAGTRVWRVE